MRLGDGDGIEPLIKCYFSPRENKSPPLWWFTLSTDAPSFAAGDDKMLCCDAAKALDNSHTTS